MKPPRPWKGGISSGSERKKSPDGHRERLLSYLLHPRQRRGIRRGKIKLKKSLDKHQEH